MLDFLSALSTPEALVGVLSLTLLELVLGIDNIIFITLLASRLPRPQQALGRTLGLLLAVATGKSRQGLNEVLELADLRRTFDATRTADETAGKPHPLMLLELMAELDVPPERVLMIGDTTHDLIMARNAECASVGVAYGAHDPASFAACQPLFTAQNVPQLHEWLLQHA